MTGETHLEEFQLSQSSENNRSNSQLEMVREVTETSVSMQWQS